MRSDTRACPQEFLRPKHWNVLRSNTRACPHKFYQNGFENFRFGGQNIEMSWGQIQEPAPTSLTKTDSEFSDFKAKTSKCLEVKYKSPVTWCPKSKMSKIRFSCPKIKWPKKRFNNKNNSNNNKNNNNNNNNTSFSHASRTARVLGVIHTRSVWYLLRPLGLRQSATLGKRGIRPIAIPPTVQQNCFHRFQRFWMTSL